MRALSLLFIIIIAAACNSKTAVVSGGSVNAEAPFLWETSFPKTLYISSDFDQSFEENQIPEMVNVWETSLNNENFFSISADIEPEKTRNLQSTSSLRDNKFGIYRASTWPYPEYPTALAITQIFALRHNVGASDEFVAIQEADVIMNYQYFEFYEENGDPLSWDDYDFRTVLLHELGHFLGLQHKPKTYDRTKTVMYPSIFGEEKKRAPLTVDRLDMAEKYGITLPLTAGGSAIVSAPKVYKKKPGDPGEMTKIILELKASGECVHHMDGVIVSRHRME